MAESVRFSVVVAACGAPEVYLPLADPRHDKEFMRAAKEKRVVTLKQEPTGTKKDYGVVEFLQEKFVTYLVFPKALKAFADKKIVGIKYEQLQEARVSHPPVRVVKGAAPRREGPSRLKVLQAPKEKRRPATPPPPPAPKPKSFTARVRFTAVFESAINVEALTAREAREKALKAARDVADFSKAEPRLAVVSLKEGRDGD